MSLQAVWVRPKLSERAHVVVKPNVAQRVAAAFAGWRRRRRDAESLRLWREHEHRDRAGAEAGEIALVHFGFAARLFRADGET